jgi:hypothetical protein
VIIEGIFKGAEEQLALSSARGSSRRSTSTVRKSAVGCPAERAAPLLSAYLKNFASFSTTFPYF